MTESTQEEKKYQRVQRYLDNLEDFEGLYKQFIVSEIVDGEIAKRKGLRSKAKRLLDDYNTMSEEEQEEFRKRRNKEGRYTLDQLKEISDMGDEEIVPDEDFDDVEIPAKYAGGDVQGRSVSEVREIMATLMQNYDPVAKDAPNFSKSKRELKEEHDIGISSRKLKRYWTAIEEKEAFNLVKRKLYMDVATHMEKTINNLFEHINNRVGSEGGEYDSMKERVDALERLTDIMERITGQKTDESQQEQGATVNQQFRFSDMETADRGSDNEEETIDVGE